MAKVRAIDRLEVDGDVQSLIYVEYSDGIACGMKLHGHYMSGESNAAGELGHTRVTDRDIPCRCGSVGCLEAVAALPALARDAKEALAGNSNSSLGALGIMSGMDVMTAAADGDRLASRIVGEAFEYLGRGVAAAVNILDPQVVLLDNRVSKAGAGAVDELMRSLVRNVRLFHSDKIQLRISELESHVGALGGAACILDYCMRR
jgi:predicted NBD/HSP70 family sugar kinase